MHRSLPIASVAVAAHDMTVDSATEFVVAALYKFVELDDFHALRERLLDTCNAAQIKGTLLLAHEGINGTIVIRVILDDVAHADVCPRRGGKSSRCTRNNQVITAAGR
jgi:hypothetical protein